MSKLRILDLFSGIGGFSLGLERTGGFETVAFCEIEPFCRRVLAKHWPEVPCYHDVRELSADRLRADGIAVDVICGGFPCQDISSAGKRAGLEGERSGLWREYARLIGELRPRFAFVENVADLLSRGMGDVLSALASLGYDAVWDCIPASYIGAPHDRDRVWIVAYADGDGFSAELYIRALRGFAACASRRRDAHGLDLAEVGPWSALPDVLRVDYGLPGTLDRLGVLGNAVVPQIPELIGRAILASLEEVATC